MSGFMMSDYDPNMLAELVGQRYNPYQGYPIKQVSDQMWDVYGPTPDYLVAQQFGMLTPNREKFSVDAFFAANPMLRGPLAQALSLNKGDTIGAYNEVNSPEMQDQLRKEIGRTEWDQIAAEGDLRMLGAITGEEKDQAGLDFYNRGLEDLLAQGAPSSQRLMQQYDYISDRMGGVPNPGAGSTPSYGGGGGAPDPLADLAGGRSGINLDASPTPTGFDAIQEVGEAEGRDRLEFQDGQRFAIIGGRRFALPGSTVDARGRNPEYQRALQAVVSNRRTREGEMKRDQKKKDTSKAQQGEGFSLRNGPLRTPIAMPF